MMMKSILALSTALLELTFAIQLEERLVERNGPPAVVSLTTERKRVANPVLRDRMRKRQATLSADLDNEQTLYFISVSLGGQKLKLDIDTGSSDLWANSPGSEICQAAGGFCSESGTYNANNSDTYKYVNSDFLIKYADGTFAAGDYATDTLNIGGKDIADMQFGIGYNSTSENGIIGIGYETNEVQLVQNGNSYPNLPTMLVNSKVTNSAAYSLWLNDLDSNTGSILFGGVDTDKYHGSLSTLPIIKEDGQYREFLLALTAVSANGNQLFNDKSNAISVLLDSGSSLSYLPDDVVSSLYDQFNADYQADQGAAIVDCSLANNDATVDFTFSSPTISVPLNELVLVASVHRGDPTCILGISPAGGSQPVLGDTFLRSAYVVYDLGNNQISLAATNFNATTTNVQEIGSGKGSVPDAVAVANAVSTAAVSTGGARNGGLPSGISIGGANALRAGDSTRTWACVITALAVISATTGLITL